MQSGWLPTQFILPSKDVVSAAQLHLLIVQVDDSLWLCETLHSFGFSVQTVRHGGGTALDCLAQLKGIAGVLLDVRARTADDRPLLPALRHRYPQMPIMTMAGRQDIDLLRASIGLGAYEYLVTPTHEDMLKIKCAKVFVYQVRADSVQPMDGQIDRAGPATAG
ncbi:MAG: response regulator [Nitrospira sp.]|nr:MAG: response regulator [Nitrospira sp.]